MERRHLQPNGRIRPALWPAVACTAAAAWAVDGVIQLVGGDEVRSERVHTALGHWNLVVFAAALLLTAGPVRSAADAARQRAGGAVAEAGLVLLAVTAASADVLGHDPFWFIVSAPLANLAWFAGSLVVAWHYPREDPARRLVFALPVLPLVAVIGARLGGGLLVGGYLAVLAVVLSSTRSVGIEAPIPASALPEYPLARRGKALPR